MSDTEYACALSHAAVYGHILENNLSGAVVLEDDATVGQSFRRFVLEGHCRNYGMVFLAHSVAWAYRGTRQELFPGGAVHRMATIPAWTMGYSVRADAAAKLSELLKPVRVPADFWPCDLAKLGAHIAHPSMVGCGDSPSTQTGPVPESRSARAGIEARVRQAQKYATARYWKMKYRKLIGVRIPRSPAIVE